MNDKQNDLQDPAETKKVETVTETHEAPATQAPEPTEKETTVRETTVTESSSDES